MNWSVLLFLREFPIIRKEMQSFIKTLLALAKPQKILEVGTAVGFSTLLMCEYGRPDLHITTIENYEKRIPLAKRISKKQEEKNRLHFWREMQEKS